MDEQTFKALRDRLKGYAETRPLKDLVGQIVGVSGKLNEITDGYACLVGVKVWKNATDDVRELDHLWISYEPGDTETAPLGENIVFLGTVTPYTRRDGSVDYCVARRKWMSGKYVVELLKEVATKTEEIPLIYVQRKLAVIKRYYKNQRILVHHSDPTYIEDTIRLLETLVIPRLEKRDAVLRKQRFRAAKKKANILCRKQQLFELNGVSCPHSKKKISGFGG